MWLNSLARPKWSVSESVTKCFSKREIHASTVISICEIVCCKYSVLRKYACVVKLLDALPALH